jgi:type IV pilus assembly protein PilO
VALKTGLEGKPWYIGLAAGLAAGLLLFAVAYWRIVQPLNDEYEAEEAKLAELQNKIQEGRAARQELPKFREEVRQLELELDKLLRILPARRNTPDLMRRIRSLTEQGDFALKSFNPGGFTDQEFFSQWPIRIELEGTYHNLALFFDRVSRFSRIINIEDLEITARTGKTGGHTIGARFAAKTFIYKEPEPEAPEGVNAPAGAAAASPADSPAARIRAGSKSGGGSE